MCNFHMASLSPSSQIFDILQRYRLWDLKQEPILQILKKFLLFVCYLENKYYFKPKPMLKSHISELGAWLGPEALSL